METLKSACIYLSYVMAYILMLHVSPCIVSVPSNWPRLAILCISEKFHSFNLFQNLRLKGNNLN